MTGVDDSAHVGIAMLQVAHEGLLDEEEYNNIVKDTSEERPNMATYYGNCHCHSLACNP